MSAGQQQSRARVAATKEEPLLSPQRAFVLQFYPETDVEQGHFVGRVEHVVSGRTARFNSLGTLVAFLKRVLGDLHAATSEGK
jgi:hypothetical protein